MPLLNLLKGGARLNLVENYLKEIISVEDYSNEWTNKFSDRTFVKVKAKWNCYGREFVVTDIFNNLEWENILKNGYYLG